jgi:RNA polymerase sigma-B factor
MQQAASGSCPPGPTFRHLPAGIATRTLTTGVGATATTATVHDDLQDGDDQAEQEDLAGDPGADAEVAARDAEHGEDQRLLDVMHAEPCGSRTREDACEKLVSRYRALVRSCVLRYRDSPESQEELMQVGYVGLLKAINNFDSSLGESLAAYAQPCISGEVKRHFRDKRWQVHVRRSAQELRLEIRKARSDLAQRLARTPTDAELAEHLGVTAGELADAHRAELAFQASSLNAPLTDGTDAGTLEDVLGCEDPQLETALEMEAVWAHLGELPDRQQRLLLMRFYGNMTQAEIGEQLGISQMHVSRLLTHVLGYLRKRILDPPDEDQH